MTYRLLSVPGTGIEPAHPCERQILSLLRLPIPPSGLISLQELIRNNSCRKFWEAILRNQSNLSKRIF